MSFWELVEKPSAQEMAKLQGLGGVLQRTMHYDLEKEINAFSMCKDYSQVVVAGRNVFKIIGIEDSGFQEKANLRVGRINLNFSITDVQWHPQEDHIIASAAGNGAVITWNLNKVTKQKQDLVFTEHKRTVNRICFNPHEPNLLLSGSQDSTMRCFDIRKKNVACMFEGKSDSIRDIQFSPFESKLFGAACDSGNIQLWDMRNPAKCMQQFIAHKGPAFTIDWHPDDKNWLGSGGRDKIIKVWDVSTNTQESCVQTIASVARIKWRPQTRYQLASCAFVVDFDIHVWDIRRPYIPYVSFCEHKDVATGISWCKDPYVFLSSSKDSTLYQHVFADANHPADHAPPIGLSFNVSGDISMAAKDKLTSKYPQPPTTRALAGPFMSAGNSTTMRKRVLDFPDSFIEASSSLFVFKNEQSTKEDWFSILAKSYHLSGRPFAELCEHNCRVASQLLLHKHAQTWSVLNTLYGNMAGSGTTALTLPTSNKSAQAPTTATGSGRSLVTSTNEIPIETPTDPRTPIAGTQSQPFAVGTSKTVEQEATQSGGKGPNNSHYTEESEESSSSNSEENQKLMNIASGLANTDILYGEDQEENSFYLPDNVPLGDIQEDWNLQNEAFEPRVNIYDRSPSPTPDREQSRPESPTSNVESEPASAANQRFTSSEATTEQATLQAQRALILPKWDFTDLVVKMLYHFAKEGDIQMSVSALLVLGDKIRNKIDEQTREQWLLSYIDLLGRLQLWSVATEIIKLSGLRAVSSLSQASTTIRTFCGRCNKPLTQSSWFCQRCQRLVEPCSLCHLTVKGLFAWCQGCAHGGHLHHMQEWFARNVWCPAGCGHKCEYT